MLQNIIVFLIVAAAAAYLARLTWASLSGKKGCNSCGTGGGCSKAGTMTQPSPAKRALFEEGGWAKAYAVIGGQDFVAPDDVKAVSVAVLAHRLHPYPSHDETVISQIGRTVFNFIPKTRWERTFRVVR